MAVGDKWACGHSMMFSDPLCPYCQEHGKIKLTPEAERQLLELLSSDNAADAASEPLGPEKDASRLQ